MKLRPSEAINLAGQDTGRAEMHQSDISLLLACPRKFDLQRNRKLELIERPRPLSLGSAYQKAIEHQDPQVGVHLLRGETICDFCGGTGWVSRHHEHYGDSTESWSDSDLPPCDNCEAEGWIVVPGATPVEQMTPAQVERLIVDEAIVEAASRLYLKNWPGGPGETREFAFKVRLRNPSTGAYSRTFDLAGKADGVVERFNAYEMAHEGYELIENKLVGQITDQKVQRLPLDRQVAIYRYGIWRATGRKVETVRYRWMRKPQIRQRRDESIEQYADRIRQDYEDRPDFYYHEEEPQFATTGDLLRIEAELWEWAAMMRSAARGRIYVRNTSHCGDFGGCAYIPICTGDPDAMSLYRRREDQPEPAEAA